MLIDGRVAATGDRVCPGQKVYYNGKEVTKEEEMILIAFNKPVGIVCTAEKREKNNVIDYINYPKNQYFRKFEMQNYFDDSWEIVFAMESNLLTKDTAHPFNEKEHSHLVGHIFARKLYKRRKYKYTYNIKVGCYNYNKIEDLTT